MLKVVFQVILSIIAVVALAIFVLCAFLFVIFVSAKFGDWLGIWEV